MLHSPARWPLYSCSEASRLLKVDHHRLRVCIKMRLGGRAASSRNSYSDTRRGSRSSRPGRLIRGRRPGLAAYRRRFKTLPHSTGPALSGSSAPLHSSPRAGNATGRGSFKRSRYCQSRSLALAAPELAGPQRKRSRRALGRSGQRAGVRPNVGGGCGDLVPPPFILKCSRSLPVLDRPSLGFYKGRLFRAVFSALLHGCCTKAGPWLGSLSLVLRHPGSAFTRQRSLVRTQHRPLVKCATLQDFRSTKD